MGDAEEGERKRMEDRDQIRGKGGGSRELGRERERETNLFLKISLHWSRERGEVREFEAISHCCRNSSFRMVN